jgi:hypothetical protein
MTPKEKARELKQKFFPYVDWMDIQTDATNRRWALRNAKKCALICVDEIIKNDNENYGMNGFVFEYWQEVKAEIELL